MNREIKFRLYSNTLKVMYSPETEIGHLWSIKEAPNGKVKVDDGDILMQYTGLKDKTGKEIYDGDILTTETDKPMIVKWNDKFASWCLYRDGWMFAHWFGESCQPEQCIVIGNRYENPELLQGVV